MIKKRIKFLLIFAIAFTFSLAAVDHAEAKRLGGSRSFGSKPIYSTPYKRSTLDRQRSMQQQRAAEQNQAARESLSKRGGLMGMLGGLALGGLLGALFFGGAFEHLNMLDFLLFALIAFLLYRVFSARRQGRLEQPALLESADRAPQEAFQRPYDRQTDRAHLGINRPAFHTDLLFKKDKAPDGQEQQAAGEAEDEGAAPALTDFDEAGFLTGAKAAYAQLQAAWNTGDLADIRGLTTDQAFAEIQDQLRSREGEYATELLKVEAELLDVRPVGSNMEAAVLFDVMMREDNQRAEQVREIWHFVRPANSQKPTWFLDGIQQLED